MLAPWSATELTGASLICGDWKPSPKCKKLWSATSRFQTIDHFFTAAKAFSLTISIKKTEVLCQVAPDTTQPEPSIKIDGTALKNVEGFTYLGSCLSSFGSLDTEISCWLSKASSALGCLWTWIWHKRGITQETKLAVYRAVVLPTLLYGCKTWTCYCRHLKKLDQFHLCCLCRHLGISWEDRVTNQEVLCCSSMPGVEVLIMKAQLRWTSHVMRMEDSCLPKQIFCSELARCTRRQGGQTKRYKDSLKNSLWACDIPVKCWEHLAADCSAWRLATHNGAQAFEERQLSQLDIKCQARKEWKANPAAAIACPVCEHICASEFGLRSHQTVTVSSSLHDRQRWWYLLHVITLDVTKRHGKRVWEKARGDTNCLS